MFCFEDYSPSKQSVTLREEEEVPVILFLGFDKQYVLKMLLFLRQRFFAEGFYCLASGDSVLVKMEGLDVVPPEEKLSDYIDNSCRLFQCDLMLVGVTSDIPLSLTFSDRYLFVCNQNYKKTFSETAGNVLFWDINDENEMLYQEIYRIIS